MKILSAKQLQLADSATIQNENIASAELMERASSVFTHHILRKVKSTDKIAVVCGTGNNGGDGLCIARMLCEKKYHVEVFIVPFQNSSSDFKINYERLQLLPVKITEIQNPPFDGFQGHTIIIDALFGTGIHSAPSGIAKNIIALINASGSYIISVDVPSGLLPDAAVSWPCVHADYCLTFETPKLGYFFSENYPCIKSWDVKSIGLSQAFISGLDTMDNYLQPSDIIPLLKTRKTFDHKGTFGHALIIAGSDQMSGAALLCGYAALKTGCGLVTIANDNPTYIYPELMFTPREQITDIVANKKIKSIAIGPGLGKNNSTSALLELCCQFSDIPLVIDADALNVLSGNTALLQRLPKNCILTPHPGEFEKLFGTTSDSFERLALQKSKSQELHCIIIYKTAFTCITFPDGSAWFNSTGNPGMATAGSGDVLTGIIAALLAQGYTPQHAALTGVFMHGMAGDMAMETLQQTSLVATEIIQFISRAFKKLS